MSIIERDRVERVARIYNSTGAAAEALGIAAGTFARVCAHYGIETPTARKLREAREAAGKPAVAEEVAR